MASLTETNCRICFVLCDESATKASEITETYFEATGYEIYPSDIPQKICKECYDQLMIVKEFRGICECSEKFLKEQRERDCQLLPTLEMSVESDLNAETEKPIEVSDTEVETDDDVRKSKKQRERKKQMPLAVLLGQPEKSLTFEEYEKYEKASKEQKRVLKNLLKIEKSRFGSVKKKFNMQPLNMDQILTQRPQLQPRKPKPIFVNWDYHLLRDYMERRNLKISDAHLFILNFDANRLSPELLRENLDTEVYLENTSHSNVLSCTFCPFTVEQAETISDILIQSHCDSFHNITFQCFRFSCRLNFPCLDLLRLHNTMVHQKQLVLIRPLQCNFCQFSCCFGTNMAKHWTKMHSEKMLAKCEHCQDTFYCDDLKLQHIVFECRKGIDFALANALESPFQNIFKHIEEDYLEEGEIAKSPKKQLIVSEQSTKSEPTLNDLLGIKYSCDYCFYSTRYFSKLKRHIEVCRRAPSEPTPTELNEEPTNTMSNKDRMVFCEICAKEVKWYRMKDHLDGHQNLRFQCDLCEKSYRKKLDLKNHIQISHLNMIIHVCSYCGASFKYRSGLLLHTKRKHTSLDQVCDLCGKTFTTRIALEYHRSSHSGEKIIFAELLTIFFLLQTFS